jgi:glycosyltransferase involved in cell wall biosynthesis
MKKILFVSPDQNPFEYQTGSAQRTNLLLNACIESACVDVLTFVKAGNSDVDNGCRLIVCEKQHDVVAKPDSKLEKWKPLFMFWKQESFFIYDSTNAQVLRNAVDFNSYDLIVTRYVSKAVEYGLMDFARKLIIDVDDLPADQYKVMVTEALSYSSKIRYTVLAFTSRFVTTRLIKQVYKAFFTNPTQLTGDNAVYLPNVPYAQTTDCYEVDFSTSIKRICFVGELGYSPNKKGIDYFLENIYKRILEKLPEVEFHIAGKLHDARIKEKWERYTNVHLLGYVEDLTLFYKDAMVMVNPVYAGGGTNIKFLEAAQMKRACVTTKEGFRGFKGFFLEESDCFVAQNDDEFVTALYRLLTDEELNKVIAENASGKVNKYYSREVFNTIVKETIQ